MKKSSAAGCAAAAHVSVAARRSTRSAGR
jgi:hypothetical protein